MSGEYETLDFEEVQAFFADNRPADGMRFDELVRERRGGAERKTRG